MLHPRGIRQVCYQQGVKYLYQTLSRVHLSRIHPPILQRMSAGEQHARLPSPLVETPRFPTELAHVLDRTLLVQVPFKLVKLCFLSYRKDMSSPCTSIATPASSIKRNTLASARHYKHPEVNKNLVRFACQCLDACFRPYMHLLRLTFFPDNLQQTLRQTHVPGTRFPPVQVARRSTQYQDVGTSPDRSDAIAVNIRTLETSTIGANNSPKSFLTLCSPPRAIGLAVVSVGQPYSSASQLKAHIALLATDCYTG